MIAGYDKIDWLEIFSHGSRCTGPEVAGGSREFWGNEQRLNWAPNAEAVFYGCETADAAKGFANRQGVPTYGQVYNASFSSDKYTHIPITPFSSSVYLFDYEVVNANLNLFNLNGLGQKYYPTRGDWDYWSSIC